MAYNSQQKLKDNIDAVRIALAWKEGDSLTQDQIEGLKSFSGFGGIKAVLYPNGPINEWGNLNASKEDLKLHSGVIELHEILQNHFDRAAYKELVSSVD